MAAAYGTRYDGLIVDYLSVQKFVLTFCNSSWQHCLDYEVTIKEISIHFGSKTAHKPP